VKIITMQRRSAKTNNPRGAGRKSRPAELVKFQVSPRLTEAALSNFQEVAEAHEISKTRLVEALILYASDIPYDELAAIIAMYLQD
jgi:hypothetical protein